MYAAGRLALRRLRRSLPQVEYGQMAIDWVALIVECYLSNAASCVFYITRLIRPTGFAALFTTFEEHMC